VHHIHWQSSLDEIERRSEALFLIFNAIISRPFSLNDWIIMRDFTNYLDIIWNILISVNHQAVVAHDIKFIGTVAKNRVFGMCENASLTMFRLCLPFSSLHRKLLPYLENQGKSQGVEV
jgi:hypothetical protein